MRYGLRWVFGRLSLVPGKGWLEQEAYDFFNAGLFAGSLPHVLVTLQRHANALGYFSPDRFTARVVFRY
jgi:hypothetical protein